MYDYMGEQLDGQLASEAVLVEAEILAVLIQCEDIAEWIDALFIKHVHVDKMVAYLVGGVGQHKDYLLRALCYAAQTHRKAVAAENGENNADGPAAELCPDVRRDIVDGGIVPLRSRDDRLGHGDYVSVADLKLILAYRLHDGIRNDFDKIVPGADDGCAEASGNCTDNSAHNRHLCIV